MKNDIMNKREFDPADGLTAFDGIGPDSVLSQDVEVQETQDAALANDVQPRSAWSKNGGLLAAAPNNNMHLASGWNNNIQMPTANNMQPESAWSSDGELLAAGTVEAAFQQPSLGT